MSEPDWITSARASYDVVADDYASLLDGALDDDPLDRAVLTAFMEKTLDVGRCSTSAAVPAG